MNSKDMILVALGVALLAGAWLLLNTPSASLTPTLKGPLADKLSALNKINDIDTFFEQFYLTQLNRSPETVTELRLFGNGPDPSGGLLDDISMRHQKEDLALAKAGLEKLKQFDTRGLSAEQALSAAVLAWTLDDAVRGKPFLFHPYLVHHLFSVPNNLFQLLLDTHTVRNRQDAEDYVARLNAVGRKFDQLIEVLDHQEKHGIVAPKFILERTLQGLGNGPQDPTQHVFYTAFVDKLDGAKGLSAQDKTQLEQAAAQAIETVVQPAYAKLRSVVEHQVAIATDDAGVWKLPDGDAYYAYLLRHHTTTDLSPEAVHNIGLAEVERIQNEMRGFFGELGLDRDDPDFGNLMRAYWGQYRRLPEMTYPDTEEGHQQAVADYEAIIHEVEDHLGELFDVLPQAPVQVRAMPPQKQGSPAHYVPPSLDGSRPGTFFANISPPPYKPGMRTLTFHEAIPGHHFHLALQQESNLPLFQKALFFTAHVEGWALYAEKLMRDIGMYPDVHSKIQNRWSELFRAARLVVDTGIHYKRWSRQEALDYYANNLGAPIANEIDRYIIWPGQATAYKIGELKILELRQRAMDALGDRFDIKQFHNLVLQHGQMPLNVLEQQVMQMIEQAQN